jgi:Bacterial pre-peptidase C-terminal domain
MVAGSVALLLSAAQQTSGLKDVTPAQLRKSLFSTARYLPAYGAYEQGNGLVQVGAAWNLLKQNPNVASIASSAPVKTTISQFLLTPDVGQGIYEREGWVAGQTGSRTITFTRDPDRDAMGDKDLGAADHDRGNHNGWRNQAATYNVILKGNDGTFSAASSLTIAPGGSASLPVHIAPATAGIHSALVILDDPSSPGYEYETEATVVAAEQFSELGNFSVTRPGASDRGGFKAFFFNVAPNTPAFKVDLAINGSGRARIDAFDPWGLPVDPNAAAFTNTATSRTFANPKAGVWEIDIEASRADVSGALVLPDVSTYNVTASELGVSIIPASLEIPTMTLGSSKTTSFTFKNLFGAFTGRSLGTAVGSAHDATPTAKAGGAQQQTLITVPSGATNLTVTIGNTSDPNADLDLYLFNCTSGSCVQAASSAGSTSAEAVSVNNPAAGTWVALVDLFAIPSGTTTYAYEDIFSKPGLGSITSSEGGVNTLRAHNDTWMADVMPTAGAIPTAGRILKGSVVVRTSAGATLGSAPISVLAVTP